MGREKYTFAQQTVIKKTGLALQRSAALWPGCRVGIAVSGGVDSFCLLQIMKIRRRLTPFNFEIMALHVNPGFNKTDHAGFGQWLASNGIAGHIESGSFGPEAHSEINRKNSACFYCARARRKRLFDLCAAYKLTHLAFGHNAEDLLSTFLLNFCRNGDMATMKITDDFFNGQLRVIRPILIIEKKFLIQSARQWKLPVWSSACPSSGETARQNALEIAQAVNATLPGAMRSMINALIRRELDAYSGNGLPDKSEKGEL